MTYLYKRRSDNVAGDQGPPRCSECGRPIAVGAAKEGRWLCEYCLIIDGFDLT